MLYHVSTKPCDELQSSDIDLIDNQHIDINSGGGIVTECDDGSRDEVNLEPSVTSLASQVLRNFTKIQKRLQRSCTQLKLLQLKCEAVKVRYRRSKPNTASNYSLKMQLPTVKGKMDMFETFVKRKLHDVFHIYYAIKGIHLLSGVHYDDLDYDSRNVKLRTVKRKERM